MGKVTRKRGAPHNTLQSGERVDRWFVRAAHASQVLLLLLGVFGYFYTVLPVYQKSLLDEEIAQKTIQLRDQEKRVAALNGEITQKQSDLAEKDRQVTAATSMAAAAKSEARGNYVKLRQEYIFAALGQLRNCTSPFHKKEPEGTEFGKCPGEALQRVDYLFADLKREDVQLFTALLKKKVAELEPQFQKIVTEYRTKKDASQTALQALEQQVAEFNASSTSTTRPQGYFTQVMDLNLKLLEARSSGPKLSNDAYFQYRKLLEKVADEVRNAFFDRASS